MPSLSFYYYHHSIHPLPVGLHTCSQTSQPQPSSLTSDYLVAFLSRRPGPSRSRSPRPPALAAARRDRIVSPSLESSGRTRCPPEVSAHRRRRVRPNSRDGRRCPLETAGDGERDHRGPDAHLPSKQSSQTPCPPDGDRDLCGPEACEHAVCA